MAAILRVILTVSLALSVTFANDLKLIKKINLKKDETKEILVKYATSQRLFKFRWTLYQNGGLVVHRSYDKYVAQNVLYLRHQNQSFRLKLKSNGVDAYNVPYLLVKFKEFNLKKREAEFELFLSDDKNQINLKYLKNSKK